MLKHFINIPSYQYVYIRKETQIYIWLIRANSPENSISNLLIISGSLIYVLYYSATVLFDDSNVRSHSIGKCVKMKFAMELK